MAELNDDEALLKRARDRFKQCEERESDNRERMREALKFSVELDQWPEEIKRERANEGTPVFDKTNQHIRRIVNEMRANMPGLKFRPVDDQADPKIAEVYDGLGRHIFDKSGAKQFIPKAGDYGVRGGFAYWRVVTEYCDPYSFDQEIRLLPLANPMSALLGPHVHPAGADAPYGFVFEDMPLEDFKAEYPNALPSDFEQQNKKDDWYGENSVRVAEYYEVVKRQAKIVLLEDGTVEEEGYYSSVMQDYQKQFNAAEAAMLADPTLALEIPPPPPAPMMVNGQPKIRTTTIKSVKWYKLSGDKVLDRKDVLGTMVPIVKYSGNDYVLPDGELRTSGAVEASMDSQRLHNYSCRKFAQQVALAPTAPYVGFVGQFKTKGNDWKRANRGDIAVLEADYLLDERGSPYPLPQRQPMPGVPVGWQQLMMNTEHGVEASLGSYGPNIGGPSRERSGVALEQQQAQGEIGNMHYMDNLAISIEQTGKILLEYIPGVYDTARVVRILGEDETVQTAFLDPEQLQSMQDKTDELGKVIGKSYNLNVGKYDVSVRTGPSFVSKRQEGAALMTEALRANPQLLPLIGHLYFKILDVPYADDIAEILKVTAPPAVQELLSRKEEGKEIDPRIQAMMRKIEMAGQQLQERAAQLQEAEQQVNEKAAQVGSSEAEIRAERDKLEAAGKVLRAEFQRVQAEIENMGLKLMQTIKDEVMSQPPMPHAPSSGPMEPAEPSPPPMVTMGPEMSMVLQQLGELTVRANQQVAESVSQALAGGMQAVADAVNRPRQTELIRDEQGNPIGSRSM